MLPAGMATILFYFVENEVSLNKAVSKSLNSTPLVGKHNADQAEIIVPHFVTPAQRSTHVKPLTNNDQIMEENSVLLTSNALKTEFDEDLKAAVNLESNSSDKSALNIISDTESTPSPSVAQEITKSIAKQKSESPLINAIEKALPTCPKRSRTMSAPEKSVAELPDVKPRRATSRLNIQNNAEKVESELPLASDENLSALVTESKQPKESSTTSKQAKSNRKKAAPKISAEPLVESTDDNLKYNLRTRPRSVKEVETSSLDNVTSKKSSTKAKKQVVDAIKVSKAEKLRIADSKKSSSKKSPETELKPTDLPRKSSRSKRTWQKEQVEPVAVKQAVSETKTNSRKRAEPQEEKPVVKRVQRTVEIKAKESTSKIAVNVRPKRNSKLTDKKAEPPQIDLPTTNVASKAKASKTLPKATKKTEKAISAAAEVKSKSKNAAVSKKKAEVPPSPIVSTRAARAAKRNRNP